MNDNDYKFLKKDANKLTFQLKIIDKIIFLFFEN